jgi:hypothetical protein
MVLRLASGSFAALCFFSCSFPDYEFPDPNIVQETCVDGLQNGEEEGVDCGGICPDSCDPCFNGRLDEDEEGVDCGGDCRADCPNCDDGVKNGSEAAIDCGGACADRCDVNQPCREDLDCASLHCDLVCQPPSCTDEILNGNESAEDCGGGGCEKCDNGEPCREASDCQSSRCQSDICVSAECTDETQNDQETDVDCGGDECAPCEPGQKCEASEDCTSLVCDEGVCAEISCDDSVLNGHESDVDCGGDECDPCEIGEHCNSELDCGDGRLCQNTLCVPQNPSSQPLTDRSKWSFSSDPEGINPEQAIDGVEGTRWASNANQAAGMYAVLDLGQTEIFFTVELQLSQQYQTDMPATVDIYVSNDGTFPDEPVVSGASGGQTRTWIPLGSAQVARYIKIEVASPKSNLWWSIGEIAVYE